MNQRTSVNPIIVTKLHLIRIQTKLVYVSGRKTTTFNENNT